MLTRFLSTFIPKSKYPNHTKTQLMNMFKGAKYSGKTIYGKDGDILRGPGLYIE